MMVLALGGRGEREGGEREGGEREGEGEEEGKDGMISINTHLRLKNTNPHIV